MTRYAAYIQLDGVGSEAMDDTRQQTLALVLEEAEDPFDGLKDSSRNRLTFFNCCMFLIVIL